MKPMETIPQGALLTVSTGEYSDYTVHGVFRALAAIDANALREEYLSERPSQQSRYHFHETEFLGWVTRKGLLEPLENWEWHLGDYGDATEMNVVHESVDLTPATGDPERL